MCIRDRHYVTKAYLSLFCVRTNKKPLFHVYDFERNSHRISQPLNEACEKDFQTLDNYEDPFFLEKNWGHMNN